jgi:hypothetical protein
VLDTVHVQVADNIVNLDTVGQTIV